MSRGWGGSSSISHSSFSRAPTAACTSLVSMCISGSGSVGLRGMTTRRAAWFAREKDRSTYSVNRIYINLEISLRSQSGKLKDLLVNVDCERNQDCLRYSAESWWNKVFMKRKSNFHRGKVRLYWVHVKNTLCHQIDASKKIWGGLLSLINTLFWLICAPKMWLSSKKIRLY